MWLWLEYIRRCTIRPEKRAVSGVRPTHPRRVGCGRWMAGAALGSFFALLGSEAACARDLRIATWNLGWHLSIGEAQRWIERCGAKFAFNEATRRWEPAQTGKRGWELKWGRDAAIEWDIAATPPCDVYQAGGSIIPVTAAAYAKRNEQIAQLIEGKLAPDVIAFQEVSGAEAVREVLPDRGSGYHVCSFEGFKVQRLAIAWRREFGEAAEGCAAFERLSLPGLEPENRVRPSLSVGLRIDGRLVRILAVHLKSSCVSPLEAGSDPNGRGALAGTNDACKILQRQIVPLEAWLEENAAGADGIVLLGDFNRNLWHEFTNPAGEPVRTDGSDPTTPLNEDVRVRLLLPEVSDGLPENTRLSLLPETCSGVPDVTALCEKAKAAPLGRDDMRILLDAKNLGCRNPIGLDHILLGPGLKSAEASKVPLGVLGRSLPATADKPDPLLAVSDHCPLMANVRY